jgi:hypothetical protein
LEIWSKSLTSAALHKNFNLAADSGIVLQKSKVSALRIFRENTKREAIVDSYNLIRVTEVAY